MHRRNLNISSPSQQHHSHHASSSYTTTATTAPSHLKEEKEKEKEKEEQPSNPQPLLHWRDVPHWLQDNPYLLTGYLPPDPSSLNVIPNLTCLHNQSLNFYSHFLGALLIPPLALLLTFHISSFPGNFRNVTSTDYVVLGVFFAAAEFCLLASAAFHLLLNVSEEGHVFWLGLDLLGIVVLTVGSFVPGLYYGFFCDKAAMVVHLGLILTTGTTTITLLSIPTFRTKSWSTTRTTAFVSLGLSGFIPLLHGTYLYGLDHMLKYSGMLWYLLEAAFYIAGVVLYVTHFPERAFPHTFDLYGSSHTLFHICILLALCSHFLGILQAFSACHSVEFDFCAAVMEFKSK